MTPPKLTAGIEEVVVRGVGMERVAFDQADAHKRAFLLCVVTTDKQSPGGQ